MRMNTRQWLLAAPAACAACAAWAALNCQAATPDQPTQPRPQRPDIVGATSNNRVETQNELSSTNYDEVVRDLLTNLDKTPAAAMDSAVKLGGLGKRALPALVDTITKYYERMKEDRKSKVANPKAATNEQVVLYTAIALARIRSGDAAKALLPMLLDTKADTNIRYTCVTANGLEYSDEAVAAIQKLAVGDPDIELRRKAYNRLTSMPKQWVSSEKLFLDALNDPDLEIRSIAAKQFYFAAPVYRDAVSPLIDFVGREEAEVPRIQALLAIARMRASEAVPFLMRLYSNEQTSEKVKQQALRAINDIAGMNFKEGPALQAWWTKYGEKQYSKLEVLLKKDAADGAANPTGEKTADGTTPGANGDKPAQTPALPPVQAEKSVAPTDPAKTSAAPAPRQLKAMPTEPVDGEIVRPESNPDDAPRVRTRREGDAGNK